jgi:cell division protease FtsH
VRICHGRWIGHHDTGEIDLAVRELIEAGDVGARQIPQKRRTELEVGVELLIANETITAEQFPPLRPAASAVRDQAAA